MKVRVTITKEDGEVLDSFVVFDDKLATHELAREVRDTIEDVHEVEED